MPSFYNVIESPEHLFEILRKFAASQGIELNNDRDFVIDIISGLLKNEQRYGYRACPCRLAAGSIEQDKDIICPCSYRDDDIKEFGSCFCGLYVSEKWNRRLIKHSAVPERRQTRRNL